ncbi:MAG: histidine phosphatase family protein [Oscillospiraceae bacterium]|nr:histidine phosphatase family protein [Ruminococcus sp.]MDE6708698.1 histidine phosphatase family protein [Oscillospiraceae bacterium]
MKINFIRHGATAGNLEKRYIGITDEVLSEQGISELLKLKSMLECYDLLITSPMLRCVQTANILFPKHEIKICEDFRECNFGDFENKNYLELSGNPDYQHWIDSNGTACFPNGELPEDFKARTIKAFENLIKIYHENMTIIAHGGTIMAILEKFAVPEKNYYDYQIPNACGYATEFYQNKLHVLTKIMPKSVINC